MDRVSYFGLAPRIISRVFSGTTRVPGEEPIAMTRRHTSSRKRRTVARIGLPANQNNSVWRRLNLAPRTRSARAQNHRPS